MHLSGNRANATTAGTHAAVTFGADRVEEEVVGAAGVRRTLRARPIVAAVADVGEIVVPRARSGQKHAASISAFKQTAIDAVQGSP